MLMRARNYRFEIDEFFNFPVMIALIIYVTNNFYGKVYYASWWTGKISDFSFCFIFPLYLTASIRLLLSVSPRVGLIFSMCVTVTGFVLVKTIDPVSDMLNAIVVPAFAWLGVGVQKNMTDITDLIALAVMPISYLYGLKWAKKYGK